MNAKYDEFRAALAVGDVDLEDDTLDLVALDDSYIFDPSHTASDIAGAVLDTVTLANQAVDGQGWLTSDPATFTGLGVGDDVAAFVLRVQSGVLIAFIDTMSGQPVNIEGDGTDVTIHPSVDGWLRV